MLHIDLEYIGYLIALLALCAFIFEIYDRKYYRHPMKTFKIDSRVMKNGRNLACDCVFTHLNFYRPLGNRFDVLTEINRMTTFSYHDDDGTLIEHADSTHIDLRGNDFSVLPRKKQKQIVDLLPTFRSIPYKILNNPAVT